MSGMRSKSPNHTGSRRAGTLVALLALVAGAFLLQAPPLAAQVADAVVEAEVVDETGLALPGVGVELRRAETGFVRTTVTSQKGAARFSAVPPATYRVKAVLSGFDAVEQGVTLRVGQSARLRFTLRVAAVAETVEVVGTAPLVDVYKTDSSLNVVPEQIQSLPVANRNFEQLAFVSPTVTRERGAYRFVTGGPVIGSGGNASQSTILVDGVDFTDPALGQAKTRFSQDAISEFRIINNRFDTEVGGSSGGALSIVTKNGTNDFRGSVFGFYRNQDLRAQGELELSKNDSDKGQYGLTLGGPIVKDRTHFFGSVEYVDSTSNVAFRPGGAYAARAADIAVPYDQLLLFGGIDQALGEGMRAGVKLDYERYRQENFRVGGLADESNGQQLNRDNTNLTLSHTSIPSSSTTNEIRGQIGTRSYDEPMNSQAVQEWYSNGTTLQTGGNVVGDLLGEGNQWELRDTLYLHLAGRTGTHDVKVGASFLRVNERSRIDTYQTGLLLFATDARVAPYAFVYGIGSSDVKTNTNRIAAWVQDDWRPSSRVTIQAGVRYDLDTNGNNKDFTHTLVPHGRDVDTNNVQPRVGFSWDVTGDGAFVGRGGAGVFIGRYLLVPNFTELQQNGETGRKLQTRVALPGLPIDPDNPFNTGYLVPSKDIALLDGTLDAPESTQASIGVTARLGKTGLYADLEGVYVKGRKEIVIRDTNWRGNASPGRIDSRYGQINTYTNDGRSTYKALTLSLNGTLKGGHILTAAATLADKKNTADDFSPEFPTGYPSDPANMDAEYGRGRSAERYRIVLSGVLRLPWTIMVGPLFEYGSGQPWTRRLGYDYNADGKNSDRAAGVERFGEDGPVYRSFNLRISKAFALGGTMNLEVIAEGFNLFNSVNDDVSAINGAQYLAGPTLANPGAAYVANPAFGKATATLSPREFQFGLRFSF